MKVWVLITILNVLGSPQHVDVLVYDSKVACMTDKHALDKSMNDFIVGVAEEKKKHGLHPSSKNWVTFKHSCVNEKIIGVQL